MPQLTMTITIKTGVKWRLKRWLASKFLELAAWLLGVGRVDFVWEGLEDE